MEPVANPIGDEWVTHAEAIRFDKGFTLTDGRTDGLTHDHQDSGDQSQVLNAPTPVNNDCSACIWEVNAWGLSWVEEFCTQCFRVRKRDRIPGESFTTGGAS